MLGYISSPALARLLNLPARRLAIWRVRGVGPKFRKAGHHVWYHPKDVRDWALSIGWTMPEPAGNIYKMMNGRERLAQLTERQREVFDYIAAIFHNTGRGPTRMQIACAFHISPNAVQDHVNGLAKKQVIAVAPRVHRGITPVVFARD